MTIVSVIRCCTSNLLFFLMIRLPAITTLFPYTTLFRSYGEVHQRPRTRHVVTPRLDLDVRSEEHTSELQSRRDIVCRLLLVKKHHTQIVIHYSALQLNAGRHRHMMFYLQMKK